MDEQELKKVCEYIKTHAPQATDFDTIDVALREVLGCGAATNRDLVSFDDSWLLPDDYANEFAGIRHRGSAQGLVESQVEKIKEAVCYAKDHKDELKESNNRAEEIRRMKIIKDELMSNNIKIDRSNYVDNTDTTDYDKYSEDNDLRKFGK